jgi:outer membrane protein OmpA-like peptidoglycan-associated protein
LELRSGLLASQLAVELKGIEPLALHIGGSAEITQLHTLDTIQDRDLVKWQSLQISGLDYNYPNELQIDKIDLNQPYVRFIINPDLSTNINDLLVDKPAATPNQEALPSEAPASPDEPDVPFALRIGGIQIADGSANFADMSLRPPFITAIQDLGGSIGTLDNRQHHTASVDIDGKVDRYAPVSIEGSLTPFEPLQSLDITTRFRQVELTTLSPYSAKFAGYRIRKGRLNLDLRYRIQQGQLNAENEVVLEELQLGEKVDSEQAVDLPVRLAVALLKDSSGTIALKIPVQGDLKNPQFDVMPIIWQTLRNLVVRAAKSPFKFLGGLVGRDQADLSQILFPPGSSTLVSAAGSNLDWLASALKERPVLRLEVEGMSAPAVDGPLLAEQWLEREYQQTWYKILQRRGDTVPADPSMLEISEDEKTAILEGIYRSRMQQQPPAEWQSLDEEARARQLRQAILDRRESSTALLRRLSRARAASIKDYLVDKAGLAADRVYLLDTGIAQTAQGGEVPTVMHLEAE